MPGPGFAVIDFETTGLFPGGHDRVVEVAVVHADPHGTITGRWETLVNPGRDLGPQSIHQIRAADVLDAPTFDEIADQLVELLRGRVVVAHNASFDLRFLMAELDHAHCWPGAAFQSLCTMQLAREFLPGAGRSLADCCAAYDIEIDDAHRASADAFATARLLEAYILSTPMWNGWNESLTAATDASWPPGRFDPAAIAQLWCPRPSAASADVTANDFLRRISIKLPEHSGPAEHHDYLALLDRCLLDRNLSAHEARGLVQLANELDISRDTCEALHLEYFDELTRIAWADGELTDAEMIDLVAVADLLDLSSATITAALEAPRPILSSVTTTRPDHFALTLGDLIVLTGEMQRTREDWMAELSGRGFVPWQAVTKKVKLVAAADPDSLSGKARKARDYGIPIVDEGGLARLLADI
jgi:DNA polymerase III subunit epsilon